MAVKIDRSVAAWLRGNPEGGTIQIRTGDPDGAVRALWNARDDINREIDPNYFTNALPAASGPFFWIDGRTTDGYEALPRILEEHLIREGVDDAVITVPPRGGPLTHLTEGLDSVRRAVVLSLYPPPPYRFYDDPPAEIPTSWLAEAVAWVKGDLTDDDLAMTAMEGGVEFPLPLGAGMVFFDRARQAKPVKSLLVTGDLTSRLRGMNGCFHSPVPRLVLAGGGPATSDEELLAVFESLTEIARRLAPGIGCAFIGILDGFGGFSGGVPGSTWYLHEGGEDPVFLEAVCDEYVFDAYPYQVLSPHHLGRLGLTPSGARSLSGDRAELGIGDPSDWLLGPYDPSKWNELPSSRRRDPRIQATARQVLSRCMLRKDEARAVRNARYQRIAQLAELRPNGSA